MFAITTTTALEKNGNKKTAVTKSKKSILLPYVRIYLQTYPSFAFFFLLFLLFYSVTSVAVTTKRRGKLDENAGLEATALEDNGEMGGRRGGGGKKGAMRTVEKKKKKLEKKRKALGRIYSP